VKIFDAIKNPKVFNILKQLLSNRIGAFKNSKVLASTTLNAARTTAPSEKPLETFHRQDSCSYRAKMRNSVECFGSVDVILKIVHGGAPFSENLTTKV
jgi:hypothetical protein